MVDTFLTYLSYFEEFFWSYIGFPAILFVGLYLTIRSRFVQLRRFPEVVRTFISMLLQKETGSGKTHGVHPLQAFFSCVGGCVGIGNIVGITTAVQIGGPGAIFWIWVVALVGSIIKYAEVYLGMRYRRLVNGEYRGGPMYILQRAFSGNLLPTLFCILMCLYGVEIYQFSVMTSSVSENFGFYKPYVAIFFLALVLFAEAGGVKRVGSICGAVIPPFILIYLGMGFYILAANITQIPQVLSDIFHYAFTSHAALGGFVGSSLLMTISQGIRRSCYSSDIGVGYASIIHSESSTQEPTRQASLTIFEVFLDTFVICTMSIALVLVTGTWTQNIESMYLVQTALEKYFPYMNYFIPALLFILGYSTIITYFMSGMKTALYLSPRYGRTIYYIYSVTALALFSFVDTTQAGIVMSCVLGLLLSLNLVAIWRLRHELVFEFKDTKEVTFTRPLLAK